MFMQLLTRAWFRPMIPPAVSRKGNIVRNVSVGQVSAADLTYAGSLIGLDYRINTARTLPRKMQSEIVIETASEDAFDAPVIPPAALL